MQLVEMLVMQKNRLAQAHEVEKTHLHAVIKNLEKQLKKLEKLTAQGLLATLPELGQLDNSAITALAGLAPYNWDSGQFKGQRRIFGQ